MYHIRRLHYETLLKSSYMTVAPIIAKCLVKFISHAFDTTVYVRNYGSVNFTFGYLRFAWSFFLICKLPISLIMFVWKKQQLHGKVFNSHGFIAGKWIDNDTTIDAALCFSCCKAFCFSCCFLRTQKCKFPKIKFTKF